MADRKKKQQYEDHKISTAGLQAEKSAAGRDIGPLPKVKRPRVKAACRRSFETFCRSYFPHTFPLPFCADHRDVIAKIEQTVLRGGQYALAMPRGSGKTSLCEVADLWAALYGHRSFLLLLGSSADRAADSLDSIKKELETNELLQGDFPEVCHAIERLERIANRCKGQTYNGQPTYIAWTASQIVLPTIPKSKASGTIIRVAGLTSSIRGMKAKRPSDQKSLRPDLVLLDDPQTEQSADSASQCEKRERIVAGAVLGLAGPGSKIAALMPCTVIRAGDMADKILDRELHPEWNGVRKKLVYSFPTNEVLWGQYAEIRAADLRADQGTTAATEFYRVNRKAMDEGSVVAWAERFNPDELSAIQHAMNLKLAGEESFLAEYQNTPKKKKLEGELVELTAEQIFARVNRHERRILPAGTSHLTAFIDVQESALYWLVAAWAPDFTGAIVDYGTWPELPRAYFSLDDFKSTLAQTTGKDAIEPGIYAALEQLCAEQLGREWAVEDGTAMRVGKCLIDSNWNVSTEPVYQFCRHSSFAATVQPSRGYGVTAGRTPFAEYKEEAGVRRGLNWRKYKGRGRSIRHVLMDVNFWKSFCHARLAASLGGRGCLTLFGDTPLTHRLLADHLTSEFRRRTEGLGRKVDEWQLRPGRRDNHWWDGLVGCAVAASMLGANLSDVHAAQNTGKRTPRTFAEFKARVKDRNKARRRAA